MGHGIIYLDLDGFKAVNDTHGHAVGDEILAQVGRRLREAIRQSDLVGRLGGDEFAALVECNGCPETLLAAGERLREALTGTYDTSVGEVELGASVGTAAWSEGQSAEAVLAAADLAMYTDKAARTPRTL
jgi:diguanylate cyclase (GGDEF)-like protein